MANFVNAGNGLLVGNYSDTKITAPVGYRALELDTGDWHVSDGTYWWLAGSPSILSPRRIGYLSPGPSMANGGIGIDTAISNATGAGSQTISFGADTTNGRLFTGVTGTVAGNRGGYRQANVIGWRLGNVRMRFKFKLLQTGTNQNFWVGFNGGSPTELTGNSGDPLNAIPGVVFGCNSTVATNWVVQHNDGTGATVIDNTGIAYDTNVHTVDIVADETNTRFSWRLDGGAYSHITADIPANNAGLGWIAEVETLDTSAKTMYLYQASFQADK